MGDVWLQKMKGRFCGKLKDSNLGLSIAVIPTPASCDSCVFKLLRFYHSDEYDVGKYTGKQGFSCSLDESLGFLIMGFNNTTYKNKRCPLKRLNRNDCRYSR
jgi:hypothetical protein